MDVMADVQAIGRHLEDRIERRDVQGDALEPATRSAFQRSAAHLSRMQMELARALHLLQVSAYHLAPVAPAAPGRSAADQAIADAGQAADQAQLALRAAPPSAASRTPAAAPRPRREHRGVPATAAPPIPAQPEDRERTRPR